ncbi:tRNA-uridine aminocarboxypropyltransferase [Vibrio pacinii]|uniref:tRNA-uridine aminocarboxypropyltransferase n=1 Tax=Vibrio pacinii TaxID=170674 RepID=UPI00056FD6D6|nr:DTW domain-containing protein [Vibrio pacinii]
MSSKPIEQGKPCPGCQLRFQCVCDRLTQFSADLHIALLMHPNETTRETNTGQWLAQSLQSCSRHIWQRTQPCPELITMIASGDYLPYLLFPSQHSDAVKHAHREANSQHKPLLLIILDGTWQEAGKMLRKSDWLRALPQVHIEPSQPSRYRLRRNQQPGHLCTIEVGCEVLRELGYTNQAQQLEGFFDDYLNAFQADKSSHTFQAKS